MDLLNVKTGSCNETCVTSSHDGNEVISIKVENILCMDEEEEDNECVLKSFPSLKSDHEVRCVCSHVYICLLSMSVHILIA